MIQFDCPLPEYKDGGFYVSLPDKWLGVHERRRVEASGKCIERGINLLVYIKFACSIAVLADWHLPNLPKDPSQWDFDNFDLELMGWVNTVVYDDLMGCFDIKKKYYSQSVSGTSQA